MPEFRIRYSEKFRMFFAMCSGGDGYARMGMITYV